MQTHLWFETVLVYLPFLLEYKLHEEKYFCVHLAHSITLILELWLAHGSYLIIIAECKKEPLVQKNIEANLIGIKQLIFEPIFVKETAYTSNLDY